MIKPVFYPLLVLLISGFLTTIAEAQTTIPEQHDSVVYRGDFSNVARGVIDGNLVETNFRNHGELARWGDIPWGIWPRGIGGRHINGIGFVVTGDVLADRAKYPGHYGGASDTTISMVEINYRAAGLRTSPYSGEVWGWLPLPGFNNPSRRSSVGGAQVIPAFSDDQTSWPEFWPDRLSDAVDPGWADSWNSFLGKNVKIDGQETFYVMDDFSDKEYAFGEETDGPHSHLGVYYPSPSDSTKGGMGLQTEVRTFQWADELIEDVVFLQYRVTNTGEKDLEKVWTSLVIAYGLGTDGNDDNVRFDSNFDALLGWDDNGVGSRNTGGQYNLGFSGFALLEHSLAETDKMDNDEDGITDESKFNAAGSAIKSRLAIKKYIETRYDLDKFEASFGLLENRPAYINGVWWTGDEDMDWAGFEDKNQNGEYDQGEKLNDDVGRDGIGPGDAGYSGPDEGEGDGIPTQGEPNFGERDMGESESRGITSVYLASRSSLESGDNLRDDTILSGLIKDSMLESNPGPVNSDENEPMAIISTGPVSIPSNTSYYFIVAWVFGEDEQEFYKNMYYARQMYSHDYNLDGIATGTDEEPEEIPTRVSLSQNYPNPFNPSTVISYELPVSSVVELKVFDMLGREVAALVNGRVAAGEYEVIFDARNLASGVYIYQLKTPSQVLTKRLTLIK